METTFLEYYKMILEKVRFDNNLLVKEYRKAINQLEVDEINDLNAWLASRGMRLNPLDIRQKESAFRS
jgi:hypothetical protein